MSRDAERQPSFKVFDYRIRTNKNTERKMLADAFRRLSGFAPVEKYRYIGFGSVTFTDFVLFHKSLNVTDMISIESKREYENRFNFNKPYDCIKMKYGNSTDILPELNWNQKTITWLDYDGILNDSVLQDVALLSAKSLSGSLIIITVNAQGYKSPKGEQNYQKIEEFLLKRFSKQIEREAPTWVNGVNLQGDEMAGTLKKIVYDEIRATLRDRNGMTAPDEVLEFEPLFNFVYSDNARMLTVGGILYKRSQTDILKKCQFDSLSFIQQDLYEIKIPIITPRERHFLNQQLPKGSLHKLKEIGLTSEEIENYSRSYRYSPAYAEIELS